MSVKDYNLGSSIGFYGFFFNLLFVKFGDEREANKELNVYDVMWIQSRMSLLLEWHVILNYYA